MRGVDTAEMRARVDGARVARLVTVDGAGRPRPVPIAFALSADTLYSAVDHKPKSTRELARLRDIEARPQVAVLVDHYEDDWSALWWVRMRGPARVLREGDERERALDLLVSRYPQYRDRRPRGPVIAVDVDEWRGWAAAEAPTQ